MQDNVAPRGSWIAAKTSLLTSGPPISSQRMGGRVVNVEFEIAAVTHAGYQRPINEDHVLVDAATGLAVVADGMANECGGEIASATACRAILEASRSTPAGEPVVRAALEAAATSIARRAHGTYERMGTTIAVVHVVAQHASAEIGHVGDVRVYIVRRSPGTLSLRTAIPLGAPRYCPPTALATGAVMVCATRDHTSVCELVERGHLAREASTSHPLRHQVNRSLGRDNAQPDLCVVPLIAGDKLIVCSDGLWSHVADEVIARIVQDSPDPDAAVHRLLTAALEAGGHDNVGIAAVFWYGAQRHGRATGELDAGPRNRRRHPRPVSGRAVEAP